jgi:hypothetical protein
MRLLSFLGMALSLVAVVSNAQDLAPSADQSVRPKEAWELTDDERITARLDPERINQRALDHAARVARQRSGSSSILALGSGPTSNFRIDGAENPELFLPFELFNDLLRGVDRNLSSTDREVARAILAPKIKSFGFEPEAFWSAFASTTARYFDFRDGKQRLSESKRSLSEAKRFPSEPNDVYIGLCRERLIALNAARDRFGRATFDRFLYQVVAPTLSFSSLAPDEAQGLRYMAAGCQ